jgi:chorismate synthase
LKIRTRGLATTKNSGQSQGPDTRILSQIESFGGNEDFRGGGHFSGRLTVCLVAAGVIAKKLLKAIEVKASILEIGGETDLDKGLQKAIDAKDSIGGIVECRLAGLPIGLGEPFFDSVESVLSHAVFAIPAVRGIEFGTGFCRIQNVRFRTQ